MGELIAFIGVSIVVIITPGPDTAMTIRSALVGGRRAGVSTAFGVVSGQACWTVAASAGVAALLIASEPAFMVVKLVGAAYLVYLGVHGLLAAFGHGHGTTLDTRPRGRLAPRTAYRQGLLSDLGNPKMAVFFTSLLPQFAPSSGPAFMTMLALGLLFCALTFAWLVVYATAVARARDFLRRPRVRRTIEGITGATLIALGVRVATEHR